MRAADDFQAILLTLRSGFVCLNDESQHGADVRAVLPLPLQCLPGLFSSLLHGCFGI